MTDTVLYLIIPFICAAFALWGSVFYEKEGWREAVRFIVLLIAAAGLALSEEKAMPMLKEMCSLEMMEENVLKYSLALVYTGILSTMAFAAFYMVTVEGLFGNPGGWLPAVGCVITGLPLATPTFSLCVFLLKNFWWLTLAVLVALAIIGAIVGGSSSGRVSASSSQGDVYVDKYGNEYISTTNHNRIYYGDETWNTSKEYHIKGQSGTFYRRIK